MISNTNNLTTSFPNIIDTIKLYMGMDKDFERLCKDFEELSETIQHLENTEPETLIKMKARISKYKHLRLELVNEITSFVKEENNNKI